MYTYMSTSYSFGNLVTTQVSHMLLVVIKKVGLFILKRIDTRRFQHLTRLPLDFKQAFRLHSVDFNVMGAIETSSRGGPESIPCPPDQHLANFKPLRTAQ